MKVGLLLYDGFCDFEVAIALTILNRYDIVSIGSRDGPYTSEAKLRVLPDAIAKDVDPGEFDALIIPGGSPGKYLDSLDAGEGKTVLDMIREFDRWGVVIGAICGGPEFLDRAGILDGRRITHQLTPEEPLPFRTAMVCDEPVVVEGNLVTAKGNAFLEFAIELTERLGAFKDDAEREETIDWFLGLE